MPWLAGDVTTYKLFRCNKAIIFRALVVMSPPPKNSITNLIDNSRLTRHYTSNLKA